MSVGLDEVGAAPRAEERSSSARRDEVLLIVIGHSCRHARGAMAVGGGANGPTCRRGSISMRRRLPRSRSRGRIARERSSIWSASPSLRQGRGLNGRQGVARSPRVGHGAARRRGGDGSHVLPAAVNITSSPNRAARRSADPRLDLRTLSIRRSQCVRLLGRWPCAPSRGRSSFRARVWLNACPCVRVPGLARLLSR